MSDAQIIERFKLLYPEPMSELNFQNPFELAIAVSLSAQCTDKKVNEVSKGLFKRFPTFHKNLQSPMFKFGKLSIILDAYRGSIRE